MILLLLAQLAFAGNQACAPCHGEIVRNYEQTPMAQSSGPVRGEGDVPPGSFSHRPSSVEYRISADGSVTYGRKKSVLGSRRLQYFIGSGAAGRSFLFAHEGFLFQAPVTYYSQKARWDMSPGYEQDRDIRWNRPVEANCLYCHASQARPIYGKQNQYLDPPFAQNGVSCERCHGPGSEHIQGRAPMVNPAKLHPELRDSVCAQCHLSGEARIEKAGKRIAMYRPGALLTDYVDYFVYENSPGAPLKATSHMEKFLASRCKTESGDRMWCGTCHNPHGVPSPEQRTSFFREKCLTCHQPDQCERGPGCISCHMPKGKAVDGGHGVLTDHAIPRLASPIAFAAKTPWRLDSYFGTEAEARSLGLAYAEVGVRTGDVRQQKEAIRLLSTIDPDSEAATRLADLWNRNGQPDRAAHYYQIALQMDPHSILALVNLGAMWAANGEYEEAARLWREALARNPGLAEAGLNLATVLRAQGRREEAEAIRDQLRIFLPDLR